MFADIDARSGVRARAGWASRAEALERKLQDFRPGMLNRVRGVAARHPWIADLAVSFPAILFALAMPRRGVDTARAQDMALAGAPLPLIAEAAGVPLWMRSMPPRAFAHAIPVLPDTPDFRRRVVNHFPKRWADAPKWLDAVADAARWSDDDVALWAAREAPLRTSRKLRRYVREKRPRVWLWAWFSKHPETCAGRAAAAGWNADMRWKAAYDRASAWATALQPTLWLGNTQVDDMWIAPGAADGYEFWPLRNAIEINAEGAAMNHCVRTYAEHVAFDEARVWSVRKNGERVATLRLRYVISSPFPHIDELAGARNGQVPHEVWLAARKWLHAQDTAGSVERRYRPAAFNVAVWRALMKPYWLSKRTIPTWLPLTPRENEYSVF